MQHTPSAPVAVNPAKLPAEHSAVDLNAHSSARFLLRLPSSPDALHLAPQTRGSGDCARGQHEQRDVTQSAEGAGRGSTCPELTKHNAREGAVRHRSIKRSKGLAAGSRRGAQQVGWVGGWVVGGGGQLADCAAGRPAPLLGGSRAHQARACSWCVSLALWSLHSSRLEHCTALLIILIPGLTSGTTTRQRHQLPLCRHTRSAAAMATYIHMA